MRNHKPRRRAARVTSALTASLILFAAAGCSESKKSLADLPAADASELCDNFQSVSSAFQNHEIEVSAAVQRYEDLGKRAREKGTKSFAQHAEAAASALELAVTSPEKLLESGYRYSIAEASLGLECTLAGSLGATAAADNSPGS